MNPIPLKQEVLFLTRRKLNPECKSNKTQLCQSERILIRQIYWSLLVIEILHIISTKSASGGSKVFC